MVGDSRCAMSILSKDCQPNTLLQHNARVTHHVGGIKSEKLVVATSQVHGTTEHILHLCQAEGAEMMRDREVLPWVLEVHRAMKFAQMEMLLFIRIVQSRIRESASSIHSQFSYTYALIRA